MKYRNIILAAAACMLILSSGAGGAWAYFTTYTQADGGGWVKLGNRISVAEDVRNWTKIVTVQNSEGSVPVFVRARAFSGNEYTLTYTSEDDSWTLEKDGYYYYNQALMAEETTKALNIKIGGVPADGADSDSFQVVVVYESTPVCYQEDGTPYGDWTRSLETGSVEGGVGQ